MLQYILVLIRELALQAVSWAFTMLQMLLFPAFWRAVNGFILDRRAVSVFMPVLIASLQ